MSLGRLMLIGFCLAALQRFSLADAVDDARREVENAQSNLDRAKLMLDGAQNAVRQNLSERSQLQQDLATAKEQYDTNQQQLSGLEKTAKSDRDVYQKIKLQQDDASKAITDFKKESKKNDRALEDARSEALKKFQKDPATLELLTKIDESNNAIQAQILRIDSDLRKTEPYGQLRREADAAEAAIKQLRQTPNTDPQTLAIASQNWMNTRNKAETELNNACNKDAQYNQALDTQSQARKTLVDATTDFKKSLNEKPEIVILIQASDQSKADILRSEQAKKTIDANLKDADIAAGKSASKYKNALSQSEALKTRRDQAASDLRQNEVDRPRLEDDVRFATVSLREADIRLQQAKQKLAQAMQRAK